MKLQDICELIVDCPHSTAQDEGEGYPLIRPPQYRTRAIEFRRLSIVFAKMCITNAIFVQFPVIMT